VDIGRSTSWGGTVLPKRTILKVKLVECVSFPCSRYGETNFETWFQSLPASTENGYIAAGQKALFILQENARWFCALSTEDAGL